MHVSPRRAAALVVGSALAVSTLAIVPAPALDDFTLSRVAGADRYETAANIALDSFASSESAVIARGDAFPDALAGSYLTGRLGAPLLLTAPDGLPESTASALDALGVETVYLLGGTGAISESVADEAAGDGETPRTVQRVAGANRFATAAEIATSQPADGIGSVGDERTAILASGLSFADALAAGPAAHADGLPVLLTDPSTLSPEAAGAIEELGIEHLVVVGGTAAVSKNVADAAAAAGPSVERVAGANRYATAAAFADFSLDELGFGDSAVDLATGEKFADALAAGPASGEASRPLLLTASAALSPDTSAWLDDHAGTLADGRVFGGTGAVADAVVSAAENAASGAAEGSVTGVVTSATIASDTYRMVGDGAEVSTTVSYSSADTFLVDGASATIGGFESSITPADRMTYTPAAGSVAARHELTNVAANTITDGVVGNVDIENKQLDIVQPVNGDALRSNIAWTNVLYSVDGASATQAAFEADVNEGDTIELTGTGAQTTLELTNEDVLGSANAITTSPLPPTTDLKIGALGDDPATGDADTTYQANGDPTATDTFEVEGQASDYDTFSAQLSIGDAVTYRRLDGVEAFELVNRAPTSIDGQAVDDLDPTSGPLPTQEGGGSFTVVTDDGPEAVTYAAGGTYIVDGSVADEAEFEAAYSAGDEIVFRAADTPSGTTQRIQLTNRTLQGAVDPESINTGDDPVLPGAGDPEPNSYGVLGQDGETILQQVTYVGSTASSNTYFLNGVAVTLERFEQELDAIAAGTRSSTVQVQTTGTGASAVTQHRLTTSGTAIGGSGTTTTSTSTTSTTGLLPI